MGIPPFLDGLAKSPSVPVQAELLCHLSPDFLRVHLP